MSFVCVADGLKTYMIGVFQDNFGGGHRILAWYVTLEDDEEKDMGSYSDHWIIARGENDAILEANQRYPGKKYQLYQDPDVLDTWFSSGLFPLSVLGWPDDKPDLSTFYPSSVLETFFATVPEHVFH